MAKKQSISFAEAALADDAKYRIVRAKAQKNADETGFDYGLEKLNSEYRSFLLPRRENRCGHELRCEVVSCMTHELTQPGHGSRA